jgi:hypothetical protein
LHHPFPWQPLMQITHDPHHNGSGLLLSSSAMISPSIAHACIDDSSIAGCSNPQPVWHEWHAVAEGNLLSAFRGPLPQCKTPEASALFSSNLYRQ